MTPAAISVRALGALSAGLLALGMLAACTPQPDPKPTPTKTALFSSDAEAFKAAEETYAEYLATLNEVDLSDARTFEPVYGWLTDTALGSEKKSLSTYHAEKVHRTGLTKFDAFSPISYTDDVVIADLCLDVSAVDLLNENNESLLQPDRATRRGLRVTFVEGDTATRLVIASNHKPDGFSC